MEIVRGLVVQSSAGHDKGDFFVVLKEENDYVFLCNGKRRMIEKTKKKKLKHIFATRTVLNEEDLQTNRKIRKALREFRK